MKKAVYFILLSLFFFSPSLATEGSLPVFVSVIPQKYFVKQIGGDLIDVRAMVQPGASPAIYEPKPSQMAGLSKTAIYFSIGVPFERVWMKKIKAANPGLKIVPTDKGIEKIAMTDHYHDHDAKHHDDTGKKNDDKTDPHTDSLTGLDPHIWLSPKLVKLQAAIILDALTSALPTHEKALDENYNRFIRQVEDLDKDIQHLLKGRQGSEFMVFHPSWGYFAHQYGLKQIAIEIEGKSPKPHQLKSLIQHAREKGIRIIFAQPQFSSKSAKLIAKAIDGNVVFADSLAENWLENLRSISKQLMEALK